MKLKDLFESTGKSVADLGIEYKGGNFDCYSKQLTSLEGAPSHVDGGFYCHSNELTSLEGAPSHVGSYFDCRNNRLTSLEGAPSRVGGYFDCSNNQLASLRGAPSHVAASFFCNYNSLTSLEGAPSRVGGGFICTNNKLTSLKDVSRQITEIQGTFGCRQNPIKSHVLGLLLINGIEKVLLDNAQVQNILNRHLGKGRVGMLQAQEELIEAGLEEFAQL